MFRRSASCSKVTNQRHAGSEGYNEQLYSDFHASDSLIMSNSSVRNGKRKDYISWQKFFMSVAHLAKLRSKDPETQVGACIVNQENKIVGIGHNELPSGCDEDNFEYWEKRDVDADGFEKTKYAFVCHAAVNAILNKNAESLVGCTLYTTLFPAHEDVKMIIQSGIKKVVYYDDKHHNKTYTVIARTLLNKAKVWYTSYLNDFPDIPVTVYPLDEKCQYPDLNSKPVNHEFPLAAKEYFMAMACLAARRSKDPARQVGACIVNKAGKIVGIGYNGFPLRVSDDDPKISWGKRKGAHPIDVKYPYVVHAEVNAIMHKTCISLEGCTLYTTLFPCNECVKVIIQAGITTIYYLRGEDETKKCYVKASIKLLDIAGYHPFCPKPSTRKRARSDSSSDQDTISKCRKLESESESGDHEKECLKPKRAWSYPCMRTDQDTISKLPKLESESESDDHEKEYLKVCIKSDVPRKIEIKFEKPRIKRRHSI